MRTTTGSFDTEYVVGDAAGAAPWVLLVHCLGGSLEVWRRQILALAGTHRVLAYDLRGQGNSANPGREYSVSDLADDAVSLMDALAIDRASVIGLSMGGMVAQLMAANHQDRVEKLVLAHTTSYFDALAASAWYERAAAVESGGMDWLADVAMQRTLTEGFRRSQPDEVSRVRRIFSSTDPNGFALACRALATFDARPKLANIAVPVLVIAGEDDGVSPPRLGQEIAASVRHGRVEIVPSAAHMSCVERPVHFNRLVERFLAS